MIRLKRLSYLVDIGKSEMNYWQFRKYVVADAPIAFALLARRHRCEPPSKEAMRFVLTSKPPEGADEQEALRDAISKTGQVALVADCVCLPWHAGWLDMILAIIELRRQEWTYDKTPYGA